MASSHILAAGKYENTLFVLIEKDWKNSKTGFQNGIDKARNKECIIYGTTALLICSGRK